MENGKWKIENDSKLPDRQDAPEKQRVTGNPQPTTPSSFIPHPSSLPISRRQVAEIVFADPAELDWLETLLHPRVRARWQAAVAADPAKDWVVEIPLLFEKSLASEFDFTLCIASSPSLQASRLAARGLAAAEITARQARQWPVREKIERADWVALNDGSVDFLRRQIVHFAGRLRASAP
jgi:dephospho-CoA kinase